MRETLFIQERADDLDDYPQYPDTLMVDGWSKLIQGIISLECPNPEARVAVVDGRDSPQTVRKSGCLG